MSRNILAVFFVLHGLVHLLYLGQSAGWWELQPGLTWPSGSWLLSRFLSDDTVRLAAGFLCVLAALGFGTAATGLVLDQAWWRRAVASAALVSTLLYVFFWNGQVERLDQQGAVGILINAAILVVTLAFRWP